MDYSIVPTKFIPYNPTLSHGDSNLYKKDNMKIPQNTIAYELAQRNKDYIMLKAEHERLKVSHEQIKTAFTSCQEDMRQLLREFKYFEDLLVSDAKNKTSSKENSEQMLQSITLLPPKAEENYNFAKSMATDTNLNDKTANYNGYKEQLVNVIKVLQNELSNEKTFPINDAKDTKSIYNALKEILIKLPTLKDVTTIKHALSDKEKKIKNLTSALHERHNDEHCSRAKLKQLQDSYDQIQAQLSEERRKRHRLLNEQRQLVRMRQRFLGASKLEKTS